MREQKACCQGTRRDGQPCTVRPLVGDRYCFAHSAATRDKRTAARREGGRNRSTLIRASRGLSPELATLQEALVRLFSEVKAGTVAPRSAEVMATVARVVLEFGRFAFDMHDAAELRRRLDHLEAQLGAGGVRAG
ncbi:MAG TPA: hypothetical protein VKV26_08890 [Dehalococcoidia bacterium]|nr:hypothetical protein [Dehalococcoidia bacterium]